MDVEKSLNQLRENWKTYDTDRFEYLVRKITIVELMKIEERKQVRREKKDQIEKQRRKREEEEDAKAEQSFAQTSMNKTGQFGSPSKGVGFYDKS